jgi:hypothetical protein
LIIKDFGERCKANFYDRDEVVKMIQEMLRCNELVCPWCRKALVFHGSHERHCLDEGGNRHDGWLGQCCCKECGKYPTIIPDFLMPHKHYETNVIEDTVMDPEEDELFLVDCPAEDSTIRRWLGQWQKRGPRAVGWLQSLLFRMFGRQLGLLGWDEQNIRRQLKRLLKELGQPDARAIAGRTNRVLTAYGHGYL